MTGFLQNLRAEILRLPDRSDAAIAEFAAHRQVSYLSPDVLRRPFDLREQIQWMKDNDVEIVWAWNGWLFADEKVAVMFKLRFG